MTTIFLLDLLLLFHFLNYCTLHTYTTPLVVHVQVIITLLAKGRDGSDKRTMMSYV